MSSFMTDEVHIPEEEQEPQDVLPEVEAEKPEAVPAFEDNEEPTEPPAPGVVVDDEDLLHDRDNATASRGPAAGPAADCKQSLRSATPRAFACNCRQRPRARGDSCGPEKRSTTPAVVAHWKQELYEA